jgi:hypothetical protein
MLQLVQLLHMLQKYVLCNAGCLIRHDVRIVKTCVYCLKSNHNTDIITHKVAGLLGFDLAA